MSDDQLNIGVVGVGFGATVHIPALQSEGLNVIAVCANRIERAEKAAEQFGIPNYFDDYSELLKLPNLDAVSISSPHHLHHEMVIEALAANKHVLCEKPFAVNTDEARQMRDAASKSKKTTMLAHEFRWAPQRAYVKELLENDYIGNLRFVQANLMVGPSRILNPRQVRLPDLGLRGGFLWGLGSHYLDAYRHWFGEITSVQSLMKSAMPERLNKQTEEIEKTAIDDTFSLLLEFENGGIGTLSGSSASPFGEGASIEIFGDKGSISTPQPLPGFNPPPDGEVYGAQFNENKSARTKLQIPAHYIPFNDERDHRLMAFRLMVREFIQGIKSGTSPTPNFEDGYRLQKILEAAIISFETGQKTQVNTL